MSIEQIKQHVSNRNNGGFPLEEAVETISIMPEENRWDIIRQEYRQAREAIESGSPVIFYLVDNTSAGGPHVIRALFSPIFDGLVVEIPQEDQYQSGRFPTVLHALEVASTVNKLAGADRLPRSLKFLDSEEFNKAEKQVVGPNIALIPLIVDPDSTNLVVFHPQARKIDPRAVALGYYELIPSLKLEKDLLRHTMLVAPRNNVERPDYHGEIVVDIWDHQQIGYYFNLLNPGRIKTWELSKTSANYDVVNRMLNPLGLDPFGIGRRENHLTHAPCG